jgi:circadian clock protein KaiB
MPLCGNAISEKCLSGRCRIEVIDVCPDPQVARKDNIVALPTLVRKSPQPVRRVIGTLSDMERVLSGLGIKECA